MRHRFAVALLVGCATIAIAQGAPPIARYVPSAPDRAHVFVLDSAHILSPAAIAMLQDSSRALQRETGADVAWVTLPTLRGRPIEEAALYIGRTWRVGSAGSPGDPLRNRGLVVLYVPDRSQTAGANFRVEVGNGLEGTITDSRSRSITNAMKDALRARRYDAAYRLGWSVAATLVREDARGRGAVPSPRRIATPQRTRGTAPRGHNGLWFALLVGLIILSHLSGGGGTGYRRRSPMDSSDRDSGGGGGGSHGGGDFGGGGGFSGGGSSDTI